MTEAAYLENFSNNEDITEQIRGEIGMYSSLINYVLWKKGRNAATVTTEERLLEKKASKDEYSIAAYLYGLNWGNYQGMVDHLAHMSEWGG